MPRRTGGYVRISEGQGPFHLPWKWSLMHVLHVGRISCRAKIAVPTLECSRASWDFAVAFLMFTSTAKGSWLKFRWCALKTPRLNFPPILLRHHDSAPTSPSRTKSQAKNAVAISHEIGVWIAMIPDRAVSWRGWCCKQGCPARSMRQLRHLRHTCSMSPSLFLPAF